MRRAGATLASVLALGAGPALGQEGDETPPTVRTEGLRTCILSHNCFLYVQSNEDASLTAGGRVVISGTGRAFRFKPIRRTLRELIEIELTFALRPRARRTVRRALQRGRRATAREKVVVTDEAGNRRVRRRSVPVVLK